MNGTLKSLLLVPALWLASGVAWGVVLASCLLMAGKSHGAVVPVGMLISWVAALALNVGAFLVGRARVFRWLPASPARLGIVLTLGAGLLPAFVLESFSVFIAFNR